MNKKLPCAKYIYSVETESIKFENYVLKNKQKSDNKFTQKNTTVLGGS